MLFSALAKNGYTLAQNLEYQPYGAAMQIALLPQLAKDIAANKVDAAVVLGWPAAAAMKDTGIPTVVAVGAGDPVATGLINSLAHPGGNITGISDNAATLSTKRLGLLKQAVPNVRKVAMLWNKSDLGMTLRYEASADAAKALGVSVQALGVGEPDDVEDAFATMDRNSPDAILMVSDPLMILNRARVFNYAAAHRLPAIYENDPCRRHCSRAPMILSNDRIFAPVHESGYSTKRRTTMSARMSNAGREADILRSIRALPVVTSLCGRSPQADRLLNSSCCNSSCPGGTASRTGCFFTVAHEPSERTRNGQEHDLLMVRQRRRGSCAFLCRDLSR